MTQVSKLPGFVFLYIARGLSTFKVKEYIISSTSHFEEITPGYNPKGLNCDDLTMVSCLVYDIQEQCCRIEDLQTAKTQLSETLFSVFHHVISDAPVTKGV